MVIPRVADVELVAARALEQLAENLAIDAEATGRLKTALVEACINAFEHGGDPDGRVRLLFAVGGGRLVVRVENRGRSFAALPPRAAAGGGPRRRGWGLTLIRQLVDEVADRAARGRREPAHGQASREGGRVASFTFTTHVDADRAIVRTRGYLSRVAGEQLEQEIVRLLGEGVAPLRRQPAGDRSDQQRRHLDPHRRDRAGARPGGELVFSELTAVNEEIFRIMGLQRHARLLRGDNEAEQR